jgi:predicted TIM-barrel fold metal-dependent hydrolase
MTGMMPKPIIDAHHHIWRLAATPWLNGPMQPRIFGEYAALRRDYGAADYAADVAPHGVAQSVYIQVNVAPGDEVEEIEWVAAQAAAHGFPHAAVGYADLASPGARAVIERQRATGRLRGIRQQLHWHDNPLYRFAARPDLMDDPAWRRGLALLAEHGLLFELQVFASQMRDAARLAADYPGLTFVLLHAGMPEDRSAAGWARWREGMERLAACPNVHVKLSGLGTFVRACSIELWQPVVHETLAVFGAERCLFGSNWPIESLWTSYGEIVAVMEACLAHLSEDQRALVWRDNAARLYGV